MGINIGIVADFDGTSKSHRATTDSIEHSAEALQIETRTEWVGTKQLSKGVEALGKFDGIWIGPGSPYQNMDGAIEAIQFAREKRVPLLGTCGGFQHMILEYGRNVLGIVDADHEESAPKAERLMVSRLKCSLAGRTMRIRLKEGSRLAEIYGKKEVEEEYLCNFGVNPEYVETLREGGLIFAASDAEGEIRGVELGEHPFYLGTLFLPQHRSSKGKAHPIISAFLEQSARQRTRVGT
jgi:CTP synthase (UTP-ammonia lyase)